VDELLAEVDEVVALLAREAACRGVALVCRGMDPETPSHEAELRLRTPRYTRMAAHLERIGPWGRRMMRQSAAIHVNLDLGPTPGIRWDVANRMVPPLTALFANSSRAGGRDTGHRSFRAHQWRHLDPSRTGCFLPDPNPPARYLEFALDASDFLHPGVDGAAPPFRDRAHEVDEEEWRLHLTTLFPEVRPRGYLELRCFDALPPRWATVPAVIVGGVLYDDRAVREARELLPAPTPALLEAGGREGLAHPSVGSHARGLAEIALGGAERSRARFGEQSVERARNFVERFPRQGRDPASDPEDRVDPDGSPLPD
jgi:glutamate--cysteine ligase